MIKVFVEEEYGYRYWVWEADMSADELVTWWKTMNPTTYFLSPATLPGKVLQLYSTYNINDPMTCWVDGNGVKHDSALMWKAHLHMEDNSWLQSPNGERAYVGD
jgi:hypothetical protein